MDYYRSCFLILAFSHLLFIHLIVNAKIDSFTIELIHRNSKFSPFYNESATSGELFRDNALRSLSRINHFRQSSVNGEKIESTIIPSGPNGGDYLMKISVGTPPIERFAVADTGSDLVWFQCAPCVQCYQQDTPLFNPTASSTYKNIACDTSPCQALPESGCGTSNECRYRYTYGDRSVTIGNLAMETFTFYSTNGETPSFPDSIFGCGNQNGGTFSSHSSGLVGLGAGPLSLISRISDEIQQTFSYCLVPMTANSNSKLRFGKDAMISSGNEAVSTPLISRDGSEKTFYYLNLEGASVGGTRVANNDVEMDPRQGNTIIDSGSTLTSLQQQFYNDLEAAVQAVVGLDPVQDPRGTYSLCYDEVPDTQIVFHFTGADVTLKTENIFRQIGADLVCMAIVPTTRRSIYGNVAQINFQVEYDLANKLVSFAPADCSQF